MEMLHNLPTVEPRTGTFRPPNITSPTSHYALFFLCSLAAFCILNSLIAIIVYLRSICQTREIASILNE